MSDIRSEAEAIALMETDGAKYKAVKDGYVLKGPGGSFRYRNTGPLDQVVYREGLGLLNVSLAIRAIQQSAPPPIVQDLDETLANHIKLYDVDSSRVDAMTIERRDEPVIFVMTPQEKLYLIDGAHRIQRRIKDGCTEYSAILLAPSTLRLMHVTVERRLSNGAWVYVDPSTMPSVRNLNRTV